MAKIKLLIDTDILIDFLKGIRVAKELFKTRDIDLYCSVLSKKELLSPSPLNKKQKTFRAYKRNNAQPWIRG